MAPIPQHWSRRLAGELLFGLMGLVAVGVLIRESGSGDVGHWLVRWPVWMLLGLAVPLVALRIVLWRRQRRDARTPRVDGA
jgi:hypothetical protein